MPYAHKLDIREIPVPKGTIQVRIETDIGKHKSLKEIYADPQEFIEFWKPLVDYYEEVKNANGICE